MYYGDCCKDCKERHEYCHKTCTEYAKGVILKCLIDAKEKNRRMVDEYIVKNVIRATQRRLK